MIIIDDKNICLLCGAYFEDNGYCVNGHLRTEPYNFKKDVKSGIKECDFCCHFLRFLDNIQGQCRCSSSKFYFDIVSKNDSCICFYERKT